MRKRNLHKDFYEDFERWKKILNNPEYFKIDDIRTKDKPEESLIELDLNDDCDCDMRCEDCCCALDNFAVDESNLETIDTIYPSLIHNDNMWEFVDGVYRLSLGVPCDKSEVSVELVDGRKVNVKYSTTHMEEGPNYCYSYTTAGNIEETLPEDADHTTLKAKYESNFLIISIAKKGFAEPILNRMVDVE